MKSSTSSAPALSPEQGSPAPHDDAQRARAAKAFWEVYSASRERLEKALQVAVASIPKLLEVLTSTPPEQLARDQQTALAAQEEALLRDNWGPLREHLTLNGRSYAERGVPFETWFEFLVHIRREMRVILSELARTDLELALLAGDGLTDYIDSSMSIIGQAYISTKETLIQRHQEAIRELSTPVLQLRDRLLIIPVVGMVDTLRARQLTESLLRAIREKRARAVVMDITGVPIVDSRVANHLVLACEAAKLMGAHVIMTGISSSIAQALVTIGAELRGVETLGDLQTGLEKAERLLASDAPPKTAHAAPGPAPLQPGAR